MPAEDLVARIRARLPDDFAHRLLEGALVVLTQANNPARAHQSAASLRELTTYLLEQLAPDADVMRCTWFKQDKNVEGPTRRQRALYSCRGGLSDEFLSSRLKIKPSSLHTELGPAFVELNKRTHARPNTELNGDDEIEEFVNSALEAIDDLYDLVDEMRDRIASALSHDLINAASEAFINQEIGELSTISGRYVVEGVLIDDAEVTKIDADFVHAEFTGSVNVTLLAGGKRDEVAFDECFTFKCKANAFAEEPATFDHDSTQVTVDTSSWTS